MSPYSKLLVSLQEGEIRQMHRDEDQGGCSKQVAISQTGSAACAEPPSWLSEESHPASTSVWASSFQNCYCSLSSDKRVSPNRTF